jgi:restriction system protein
MDFTPVIAQLWGMLSWALLLLLLLLLLITLFKSPWAKLRIERRTTQMFA